MVFLNKKSWNYFHLLLFKLYIYNHPMSSRINWMFRTKFVFSTRNWTVVKLNEHMLLWRDKKRISFHKSYNIRANCSERLFSFALKRVYENVFCYTRPSTIRDKTKNFSHLRVQRTCCRIQQWSSFWRWILVKPTGISFRNRCIRTIIALQMELRPCIIRALLNSALISAYTLFYWCFCCNRYM